MSRIDKLLATLCRKGVDKAWTVFAAAVYPAFTRACRRFGWQGAVLFSASRKP